jgi:hypothetical protein
MPGESPDFYLVQVPSYIISCDQILHKWDLVCFEMILVVSHHAIRHDAIARAQLISVQVDDPLCSPAG